jgi:hypothetical protein
MSATESPHQGAHQAPHGPSCKEGHDSRASQDSQQEDAEHGDHAGGGVAHGSGRLLGRPTLREVGEPPILEPRTQAGFMFEPCRSCAGLEVRGDCVRLNPTLHSLLLTAHGLEGFTNDAGDLFAGDARENFGSAGARSNFGETGEDSTLNRSNERRLAGFEKMAPRHTDRSPMRHQAPVRMTRLADLDRTIRKTNRVQPRPVRRAVWIHRQQSLGHRSGSVLASRGAEIGFPSVRLLRAHAQHLGRQVATSNCCLDAIPDSWRQVGGPLRDSRDRNADGAGRCSSGTAEQLDGFSLVHSDHLSALRTSTQACLAPLRVKYA